MNIFFYIYILTLKATSDCRRFSTNVFALRVKQKKLFRFFFSRLCFLPTGADRANIRYEQNKKQQKIIKKTKLKKKKLN